jgi:hypothetical protein
MGGALALAMVAFGAGVQIASMRRSTIPFEELPPFVRGGILAGFVSLFIFAGLIGAAMYWRSRPETHKRLILLGTIAVLGAAAVRVARFLGAAVPALGSVPFLDALLTDLFLVALAAHDVRTRQRLHPATLWGGLAIVAMQVISNSAVPHTAIVRELMQPLLG